MSLKLKLSPQRSDTLLPARSIANPDSSHRVMRIDIGRGLRGPCVVRSENPESMSRIGLRQNFTKARHLAL